MKTPYIKHTFGDEVDRKLRGRRGWLTAGVASSISWPSFDVCILYGGDEYFLRGSELGGKPSSHCRLEYYWLQRKCFNSLFCTGVLDSHKAQQRK